MCRILKSYDLIISLAYLVLFAAEEPPNKTTRPNELWQTEVVPENWTVG